jgi:hypothetical protein
VAFGRCRKNRGGTPTGERARSGGSAQAGLSVPRPARRLRAGHETLRLPAFRFLISFFRRCERSEAIQFVAQCWIASSLRSSQWRSGIVGCLTKLRRDRAAGTGIVCTSPGGGGSRREAARGGEGHGKYCCALHFPYLPRVARRPLPCRGRRKRITSSATASRCRRGSWPCPRRTAVRFPSIASRACSSRTASRRRTEYGRRPFP